VSLRGITSAGPSEQAWIDLIAEFGHTVLSVADAVDEPTDAPPFTYSTGAFESYGAPELILFGLDSPNGAEIINDFVADFAAGRHFRCGVTERGLLADDVPVVFLEASADAGRDYVLRTERYYRGDPYPLWQLFWPAENGSFPWEPGCPPEIAEWQPNLTGVSWEEALARYRA
jgi:hypothetical protein